MSVPLSWSWRLEEATLEERQNYEISPSGYAVHWPGVDKDLSVCGALREAPVPRLLSLPVERHVFPGRQGHDPPACRGELLGQEALDLFGRLTGALPNLFGRGTQADGA